MLAVLVVLALHFAPAPMLEASNGATIAYDPRLNFLSELVRTQYGPAMIASFLLLALASAATSLALPRAGLSRESWLLGAVASLFVLLAAFPTDLAELRTDASTCGDPSRIEPCTFVGRVHDVLPNALFVLIGSMWISLWRRGDRSWRGVVIGGLACGLAAVILLLAAHLYLRGVHSGRWWVGLMQRAVVVPGLAWLWIIDARLARG